METCNGSVLATGFSSTQRRQNCNPSDRQRSPLSGDYCSVTKPTRKASRYTRACKSTGIPTTFQLRLSNFHRTGSSHRRARLLSSGSSLMKSASMRARSSRLDTGNTTQLQPIGQKWAARKIAELRLCSFIRRWREENDYLSHCKPKDCLRFASE